MSQLLLDLNVLVLEDEYLIAMDVEQLCRDNGARDVTIANTVPEEGSSVAGFNVAILDLMLNGTSTLSFARKLAESGVPFVFASGYSDRVEIEQSFPGVPVVGKPYAGDDLVTAVAAACGRL